MLKDLVTVFNECGAVEECVSGFLEKFEQAYVNELQKFVNCIVENRKPTVTVYDGTNSTKIAYVATESFKNKKFVYMD